ncbi:uncharacterized protein C8R40DRAFT_847103 [Lentinula edodes]|uniref:uncharacterized protein n=1 Tax=Lentinula edodes TaxID=5353 RepID=UPI001E8E76F5|nr:uncharacterized protein C8R40DRAFT_847103 [Lentinula edodes]KAH7868335.1 hypothetical protein C8R40DRAFT_847103 [Lentinula edodes]
MMKRSKKSVAHAQPLKLTRPFTTVLSLAQSMMSEKTLQYLSMYVLEGDNCFEGPSEIIVVPRHCMPISADIKSCHHLFSIHQKHAHWRLNKYSLHLWYRLKEDNALLTI